jgi:hypothetical protein
MMRRLSKNDQQSIRRIFLLPMRKKDFFQEEQRNAAFFQQQKQWLKMNKMLERVKIHEEKWSKLLTAGCEKRSRMMPMKYAGTRRQSSLPTGARLVTHL